MSAVLVYPISSRAALKLPVSFMKNKKELITLRYDLAEYRFEKDTAVINHTHKLEPSARRRRSGIERQMRVMMVCS